MAPGAPTARPPGSWRLTTAPITSSATSSPIPRWPSSIPGKSAGLPSLAEADFFRAYGPAANVDYTLVASPDGRAWGTGLNRLKLLQGRLPDPSRADDAVADFTMPGVRIGQRVSVPLIASRAGDTRAPAFSGR